MWSSESFVKITSRISFRQFNELSSGSAWNRDGTKSPFGKGSCHCPPRLFHGHSQICSKSALCWMTSDPNSLSHLGSRANWSFERIKKKGLRGRGMGEGGKTRGRREGEARFLHWGPLHHLSSNTVLNKMRPIHELTMLLYFYFNVLTLKDHHIVFFLKKEEELKERMKFSGMRIS